METELVRKIREKVSELSTEKQEQVLKFVERQGRVAPETDQRPIWEVIAQISSEIPLEEWEKLPSDGSVNHDHYLYGSPKRY